MKRIFTFLFTCIVLSAAIFTTAIAADYSLMRSSEYLKKYQARIQSAGNGTITIYADIEATGPMTQIGMDEIEVQCLSSGKWDTVDTIFGTTRNGMLKSNASSYSGSYKYRGLSGKTYRAIVTAYAQNRSGFDSVSMTTNSVAA